MKFSQGGKSPAEGWLTIKSLRPHKDTNHHKQESVETTNRTEPQELLLVHSLSKYFLNTVLSAGSMQGTKQTKVIPLMGYGLVGESDNKQENKTVPDQRHTLRRKVKQERRQKVCQRRNVQFPARERKEEAVEVSVEYRLDRGKRTSRAAIQGKSFPGREQQVHVQVTARGPMWLAWGKQGGRSGR